MRLLGILAGATNLPHAVHIYRITMPLAYIEKRSRHKAAWTDGKEMAISFTQEQIAEIIKSDVIIIGRMIGNDYPMIDKYLEFMSRGGAKLIYETDDDLTQQYRDTSNGENKTSVPFLSNKRIDAFTVTTPYLARQIEKFSAGQPVYVIPNAVETSYWAQVCRNHEPLYSDKLNIMLVGTPTHGDDWTLAHKATLRILDEFPNTRLLVGGYQPDYIDDSDRIVKLPFVEYMNYPKMLREADIVLCAIDPHDLFNHSKSAVKAMEAWSAQRDLGNGIYGGAAVVATNSVVYNGTVRHEKNGLLVDHNIDSYYDALKRLVKDDLLRRSLQRTGMLDVLKKHSIVTEYRKWLSVYTQVRRIQ